MSLYSGLAAVLRMLRTNGKWLAASAFAMCVFAMIALYGQLNHTDHYVAMRSRSAHTLDGHDGNDVKYRADEMLSLRQLHEKQEQLQRLLVLRQEAGDSTSLLRSADLAAAASAEPSAQQQQQRAARAPLATDADIVVERSPTAESEPLRQRLPNVGLDSASRDAAAKAALTRVAVGRSHVVGSDVGRAEAADRARRLLGGDEEAAQETTRARAEQRRQDGQAGSETPSPSDVLADHGRVGGAEELSSGRASQLQHGSRPRVGPGAAADAPGTVVPLPIARELLRTPSESDDGAVSLDAAAAGESSRTRLLLRDLVNVPVTSRDPPVSRPAAAPVGANRGGIVGPVEVGQDVEPRRTIGPVPVEVGQDVEPRRMIDGGGIAHFDDRPSTNWSIHPVAHWMQGNNAGLGRRSDNYGSGAYGRGTTAPPVPLHQWLSYDYESAVGVLDIHVEHAPDVMTASLGEPWPMPQHYLTSHAWHVVDLAAFKFVAAKLDNSDKGSDARGRLAEGPWCGRLRRAVDRYTTLVKETIGNVTDRSSSSSPSHSVLVVSLLTACSDDDMPHERMEESYYLRIDAHAMQLTAVEVWGVLRGLETFSQLLYVRDGQVVVNETVIRDYPSYGYRGVMLDTARHYLPVPYIKKSLDAMSYNKFNVFHWHIVDDNSFPYESKKFPDLSKKGAYSSAQIYSVADIRDIIAYAADRGIRVVPEFDTPGHTRSWGNAFPMLLTNCSADYEPFGAVNPILQSTYDFFSAFFAEAKSIFPDSYVHIGGDEINYKCWLAVKEIRDFMIEHNMTTSEYQYNGGVVERLNGKQLQGYYTKRLLEIMPPNTKKIAWDEAFLAAVQHNLSRSDLVIHVWQQGDMWQQLASQVMNEGFSVIVSACWYLNYISYGIDWHKYYECDLKSFEKYYNIIPEKKSGMLGGSVCLWSEHIDENNLEPILWPRAIAPAEKLWSSELLVSPTAAQGRFEQQHCRLLRRGIRAAPGNGPGSCFGSMKVSPPL